MPRRRARASARRPKCGRRRRRPATASATPRLPTCRAEGRQRLPQRADRPRTLVVVGGQPVEQQIGRAGLAGRCAAPHRLARHLPDSAADGESAGELWRRTRRGRCPGQPTSMGSSRFAAFNSSGGASLPRLVTNASCARIRSIRARWSSVSGPTSATASISRAAIERPASTFAAAAASARSARSPGRAEHGGALEECGRSGMPAPRLRPVGRALEFVGDVLVWPGAASARCQARRSASSCGSVTSASARCTRASRTRRRPVSHRSHKGWRNRTGVPNSTRSGF